MLVSEKRSGAAHPGLYFIDDQQHTMLTYLAALRSELGTFASPL